MAFCKYCGKELREGMRFCGGCGNAVEVVVPQKQIIYEEEKPMESILDNKTVVALTLGVLAFSLVAITDAASRVPILQESSKDL